MSAGALTQKVREGGRIINVHVLVATGVNADGRREILGLKATSAEDGAGWPAFLRGLVACGLSGVQLVISDCHARLVAAIGATVRGHLGAHHFRSARQRHSARSARLGRANARGRASGRGRASRRRQRGPAGLRRLPPRDLVD
jgi:hypothetical protein